MYGSDPGIKLDKKYLTKELAASAGRKKTIFQLKSSKNRLFGRCGHCKVHFVDIFCCGPCRQTMNSSN